ncbi:hypothetical protein D3C72_1050730 [compost metagenome]
MAADRIEVASAQPKIRCRTFSQSNQPRREVPGLAAVDCAHFGGYSGLQRGLVDLDFHLALSFRQNLRRA